MKIKSVVLLRRKPGTTHEQFVDYYENHHVPLALGLMPSISRHVRNYVDHSSLTTARQLSGEGSGPDPYFDVITEVWFDDEAAHAAFRTALSNPDVVRVLQEDEDRFLDPFVKQSFDVFESEPRGASV
ncbi:MAG: EthD family reductase [Microbacteriaceae bacterium]|jgi:uncharacterized protein (TIGR02118 family)|nr:EthD family reductase [Microbacteriaceae bacterium]